MLDYSFLLSGVPPKGPERKKVMDLLDAASRAGLDPKKMANYRGGEYRCACPYCGSPGDGKSDRFLLWPDYEGGKFRCRHCSAHGDTVQLLVDKCGCTYPEAFEAVGKERPANYRPAKYQPVTTAQKTEFQPRVCDSPIETWQIKAEELVNKAHVALLVNNKELAYLEKRGLDKKAVKSFKLGYLEGENGNNCRFRSRKAWGLPAVMNEKTGRNKALWIPSGIVIPKFYKGKVDRIRIRRPDEDIKTKKDIRYYALQGSSQRVMGHNPDRKAFVVIEAELDEMMVCHHAGSIVGTVGLGSSGIKPDSKAFYILKKALRILVALDHDKAGKTAWKWWRENFDNARLWPVPVGKDPGEAFEQGLDIKEWVRAGLPPVLTMESMQDYKIPAGISHMQELRQLLSAYPVTIEATPETGKIHFEPGFKQYAIRQRIHDLFHKDDEIHWYLRMYHPATIIDGNNCEVMKETA